MGDAKIVLIIESGGMTPVYRDFIKESRWLQENAEIFFVTTYVEAEMVLKNFGSKISAISIASEKNINHGEMSVFDLINTAKDLKIPIIAAASGDAAYQFKLMKRGGCTHEITKKHLLIPELEILLKAL